MCTLISDGKHFQGPCSEVDKRGFFPERTRQTRLNEGSLSGNVNGPEFGEAFLL